MYHGVINQRRIASYTATMMENGKHNNKPFRFKKRAPKRFGVTK